MDWGLYEKYGDSNEDGYWINDHERWDYFANNPKLYRKNKVKALLFLAVPIVGAIFSCLIFDDMGLDFF